MLRRLLDLPGVASLEQKALMNPRYTEADAREHYPEIDQCSVALFGITAGQAEQTKRPSNWDGVDRKPVREQIEAFEREGWDVTDGRRRPLRMFEHFNAQLWLALRGVAGKLPYRAPEDDASSAWSSSLQADAAKFKRDRR
jgi:hypothetical protein